MIRAALIQLCASDDPQANLPITLDMIRDAAAQGADLIVTPEVTNCVSTSRGHQASVLVEQADDLTLRAICNLAKDRSVWIVIGSLALASGDNDGRFVNRSFLVGPDGVVKAWYDKIHMFDVTINEREQYRESAAYRPGNRAVVAQTDVAAIGLSICYDVRFPALYQTLARGGAQIITIPAAFSPVTGAAHWESLLRARAIETGAFILAPAQVGDHELAEGRPRQTHGHSLAIDPWGRVLCDAGQAIGVNIVDLDLSKVKDARKSLPTLSQHRDYRAP